LGSNIETQALSGVIQSGVFGSGHVAFNAAGGGQLQQDWKCKSAPIAFSTVFPARQARRAPAAFGGGGGEYSNDRRFPAAVFDVLAKGIADAFDLLGESAITLARYSTARLFDAK